MGRLLPVPGVFFLDVEAVSGWAYRNRLAGNRNRMMSQHVAALFHYLLRCYGDLSFPRSYIVSQDDNLSQGQDVCESRSWLDDLRGRRLFDDEDELHDVVEELRLLASTAPKYPSCHHGKWSRE
jgi:hypothetical protein